jgi:Cdc6-like AAA superfamily ATPase
MFWTRQRATKRQNPFGSPDLFLKVYRNIQASDGGAVIVDPPPRTPEQRYRQSMLNKVQRIWIDGEHGVLKHSLSNEVLITLGLSTQPTARMEIYHAEAQQVEDQIPEPLPPNTRILDVYDSSREALLILGAPGAGKTTLLLELTQHLLQRAREDEAHPIPVVFPLSSWVASSRPLEE